MPEYLAPGVYVEEIPTAPPPITGVPTSIAAFLGVAERGTTTPRLVTGLADYGRWFGGAAGPDEYLCDAVQGFFQNGGSRAWICNIAGEGARAASLDLGGGFIIRACGPGDWGNRLRVLVRPVGAGAPGLFRLSVACLAEGAPDLNPFADDGGMAATPPECVEEFDGLVMDEASPDYVGARLPFLDLALGSGIVGAERSALFVLERAADAARDAVPSFGGVLPLAGGVSGARPGVSDFAGEATPERPAPQGFAALEAERCREVALVHAPGRPDVAATAVAHCEKLRHRFAVIDLDRDAPMDDLDPRLTLGVHSGHAACYVPWLLVRGAAADTPRLVPPGGHVLGVYARTDADRGVSRAPANAPLSGVPGLQFAISDDQQATLAPRGVNVIRAFPGRGIRVWGARTLSRDPEWRYVNVRRLVMFVEQSILEGTQWVVFEPNGPALWARVGTAVRGFLQHQWRQGALQGNKQDDAFFVRCGVGDSMSEDDVRNGRLVCVVGIATIRPAEFTVLRLAWATHTPL